MPKEALVVPREALFKDLHFEGFLPAEEHNFIPKILENYKYHIRGDELEHDSTLQQIIPYVWLVNLDSKKVFAYIRTQSKGDYQEKRLYNKFSCGLGGHIDKEDSENPIMNAMMRELQEEVIMSKYPTPETIGYVNLEHDIHAVHFGIVSVAHTNEENIKSADGVKEGKWFSVEELESAFANPENNVEEWTRVTWPFIKNYLQSS